MTAATSASPATVAGKSVAQRFSLVHAAERYALVGLVVAVAIFFAVLPGSADTFPTAANLRILAANQAVTVLLALAVLLPLVAGHFDFSVGAVAASSSVVCAGLMQDQRAPLTVAMLAAVGVGLAVGLANGLAVAYLQVNAFVSTLAVATLLGGFIQWYTGGQAISNHIAPSLLEFGSGTWAGVPRPIVVVTVVALLGWYVLSHTPFGRALYAVGENTRAANLVGIPTRGYTLIAFVGAGTIASIAGVILTARTAGATADSGTTMLFPVLAAVFLGATAIRPGRFKPSYFLFGVALVAIGTVFYEIATVNYNAMLVQVSTPKTVGRVSGFGWGAGYLGGIVLLLIVYFGMVTGDGGLLHVPTEDGLNIRFVALIAALWTLIFSLPVLFVVPEIPPNARTPRVGFFASYAVLVRDIGRLWKESRNTVLFLIASALFRDGLVGVFTFGGILAQGTFGFTGGQVIIFAIAANVVAGVSTLLSGRLDDRFGPKAVIVTSLVGLIVAGLAVFFTHDLGATAFWVGGLVLCLFVGPAQSASRTFLARVTPAGREGEVFGLYATTGRAATFLAPALFSLCITLFGAQYWGILGILVVLLAGLVILIPVRSPERTASAPTDADAAVSAPRA